MKNIIGIALIAVGAVLLYYGLQEPDVPASEVEEAITGHISDRSLGKMIGGAVLIAVGGALLLYRLFLSRRPRG